MLTDAQIQAIRQRTGIQPQDTAAVDREAELRAAWGEEPQSAIDKTTGDILSGFQRGGERVASEIGKIGTVEPGETPAQAIARQPFQVAKTIGTASLESMKGAGAVLASPFMLAWNKLPEETRATIGSTFEEGVKNVVHNLPEGAQQTLANIAKKLKENPDYAEIAQDSVDLLFNAAALKVGGTPKTAGVLKKATGEALSDVGKAVRASGAEALDAQKMGFAEDLVAPIRTKAVKEEQVARSQDVGWGPFRRTEITPTTQEQRAAEAVARVPGVKPNETYQYNYNAVSDYNSKLAQTLEHQLVQNDFAYPRQELKARIRALRAQLAENPALAGSKGASKLLLDNLEKRIDEMPAKGSNLLQIRKDFDEWVENQKGEGVFDPEKENEFTLTLRGARGVVNDFLEEKATSVRVKPLLAEQRALYDALDTIKPKAAQEADTAIGRVFQNMMNAVGLKNHIVQQIAALTGIGGLGAAATYAPVATGAMVGSFVMYKAGKLVLKPQLRIYLGQLLEQAGNKISESDRAYIKQLLESSTLATPPQMLEQKQGE